MNAGDACEKADECNRNTTAEPTVASVRNNRLPKTGCEMRWCWGLLNEGSQASTLLSSGGHKNILFPALFPRFGVDSRDLRGLSGQQNPSVPSAPNSDKPEIGGREPLQNDFSFSPCASAKFLVE